MAEEPPDPIPRALRRYAIAVTWLFVLLALALVALIVIVLVT